MYCSGCRRDCKEPDYDSNGFISCTGCGKILSENQFQDEPNFVKNVAGQCQLSGNIVRSVQSDYSLSRERILENAGEDMSTMAHVLGMDDGPSVVNPAKGFYRIALDRNFTRGRRRELVQASCLYIACREKKKPYLLIDFSEYLRVNVYVLGGTFLQLCQLLCLHEHPIVQKLVDPSLFMHRFTNRLMGSDCAEVTNRNRKDCKEVSRTALLIIASMKRDWMQTGRKPSGLCGAALYISALSHGYKFSKSDIVKVVHICEATLTKRLIEFENTDSASLSIEELNGENNKTTQANNVSKGSGAGELLCEHRGSRIAPFAHGLCESCYNDFVELSGGLEGGSEPPAFQRAERERIAKECTEENVNSSHPCQDLEGNEQDMDTLGASAPDKSKFSGPCTDGAFTNQVDEDGLDKGCEDGVHDKDGDESDNFSDIDDVEVDSYLHNEQEKHYKKIIWEEMNREYVEEQAAKEEAAAAAQKALEAKYSNCPEELQAAQELAAAAAAVVAKSRKEKQQKRAEDAKNAVPARTAVEAAHRMLTKKRLSSKIKYDVLKTLFEEPVVSNKKSRNDATSDNEENTLNIGKENKSKASYENGVFDRDDEYDDGGGGEQEDDENPYYVNGEEGSYFDDYYEEY